MALYSCEERITFLIVGAKITYYSVDWHVNYNPALTTYKSLIRGDSSFKCSCYLTGKRYNFTFKNMSYNLDFNNSAELHRNQCNFHVCPQYSFLQRCPFYLISFIPADILHFGEFLGSLHHKVNEVPTSTQTADDEKVGQDPEKSCQMDIFFFVTLLFIHYWFLNVWK